MPDETETRPETGQLYQQWVQSILARSQDAWTELHHAFGTRLEADIRRSLRKWGLPVELVDDVAQDTWRRALNHIVTFDWQGEEKFYHWLRSISAKCVYELNRNQRRTLSESDLVTDDDDSDLDLWAAKHSLRYQDIEDQINLGEQMVALDIALHTLKPREREIFLLWLMGKKPRMLAVLYDIKVDTISQMLRRASHKVQSHLLYLQSMRGENSNNE